VRAYSAPHPQCFRLFYGGGRDWRKGWEGGVEATRGRKRKGREEEKGREEKRKEGNGEERGEEKGGGNEVVPFIFQNVVATLI